jgi:hypothetical protein
MRKFNSDWIEREYFYRPKPGTDPKDQHYEQYERPVIVCLCGSTRFREAFEAAQRSETDAGKIVLTVGRYGHHDGLDMSGEHKAKLDALHCQKIDLADEVLILNVGGYVGDSTRREVQHAARRHKRVRWLEPDKVPIDLIDFMS